MRTSMSIPRSGGKKLTPFTQSCIRGRILAHAAKHYAGKYDRIDVRFRGAFCYIDAYVNSEPHPVHLVRLSYHGNENSMSVAFYAYSSAKYEPTFLMTGDVLGTPEDGFDVGAVYLQ